MPGIRNKSHNEMMNILNQFIMAQMGFAPVGEIRMLTPGSGNAHNYFRDKINDANRHTSIYKAYEAAITQRNDVILVTPDSHAWKGDTNAGGEALTWSKQSVHLLGMSPGGKGGYGRARFGHSGYTMANFATISGTECVFKNLRFMHGASTGGASDVRCVTISGAGNKFENVNFGGPMDATQAASANYIGVEVSGTSNYFKDCVFGTSNNVVRDAANCMLKFSGGGPFNVFEDCIFRSNALGDADPFFINWASTESATPNGIFLNCQFINNKAAAGSNLLYAITDSSHANNSLFFDNRCTFMNVADIVATASSSKIKIGAAGANPDTTAIADRLQLGIAQSPAVG